VARYAVVKVTLADVEPVASFIARVLAADAPIRKMTAAEAAALPGTVAAGIAELQGACRDLAAGQPPGTAGGDGEYDDGSEP
jgi:hypothetical protein